MRATILILLALVLFLAGLGASKTCVNALQEHEIMSMGRRVSTLVRKDQAPGFYWVTFSLYGITSLALFFGSAVVVRSAIRGNKKGPQK